MPSNYVQGSQGSSNSLCTNIADMCVPFQTVSNRFAKVLDFFSTLFRIVPSKV